MSRFEFAFVLMLGCTCVGISAHADEDLAETQWMKLIVADAGRGCAVKKLEVTFSAIGNNGARFETWVVQTCQGQVRYHAAYYPPLVFPSKASPYEVKRFGAPDKAKPASSPS